MQHYSSEVKEAMVAKLCSPGGPSVYQLVKETGISQGSLYRWVESFGSAKSMKDRRPEDWSAKERLEAVFEAEGLSELELGEFLRKKGLHSNHIVDWKKEALSDAAEKNQRGRPKKDPELVALEEENKLLKRDLHRKDRALAEQTALLILQKKADARWSKYEDDE